MRKILALGMAITSIVLISGCSGEQPADKAAGNEIPRITSPGIVQNKNDEMKTASGLYVGQIDGNSIEVNTTDPKGYKETFTAFRFSEDIKKNFSSYSLRKNDFITVKYNEDSNGSKIIYEIKKVVQGSSREKNKKIEVQVEGEKDMRNARLTMSDSNGYSFYLLDNFAFSPEEPRKDIIFSNYDKEFFVRIESLDENADLIKLKETLKSGYSKLGKVNDIEPSTLFTEKFKDSKFCFHVEIPKSQNIKTQASVIYVVKEFNGHLYSFTFNMPSKEAAEGLTPSLWAMVSTIEAN